MKIGVIGLGDIAQKAYLPVLCTKEHIELVICTRNVSTLNKLAKQYRIPSICQTVDELIELGVDAAFVNTSTDSHFEIAEKLLQNQIHVYIDKPISMNFQETKRIVELAKEQDKIAMVGFNRRFIPRVKELTDKDPANLIVMQKNRFAFPEQIRRFVVEDFIHVVDTLRFLMKIPVRDVKVEYLKTGDMLEQLVIQLIGERCIAIGIMNRNTGVTEEIIEYMSSHDKYVISSLVETTHYHQKETQIMKFGDWEPTLYKRGFHQIVDHFIDCVQHNKTPNPSIEDSLISHEICEQIVSCIENKV